MIVIFVKTENAKVLFKEETHNDIIILAYKFLSLE